MKKRNGIILLLFMLIIGFAVVSTSLFFSGTATISTNKSDFDIIFVEAILNGDETKAKISENKKNLTFTTELYSIGSSANLNFKVKNISTQYDGKAIINCSKINSKYLKLTGNFDGINMPMTEPTTILASEVKSGSINVLYDTPTAEDEVSVTISCTIDVIATSRDNIKDPAKYNVNFNANGGEEISSEKLVKYYEEYGTLPTTSKRGYTFKGWYLDDKKITEESINKLDSNHTLEAHWEANEYTVNFDTNNINATLDQLNKTVTFDSVYGELPTPVLTDYDFAGWYNEDDELITSESIVSFIDEETLTAHWERPTAPVVTASGSWETTNAKSYIATPGIAPSGINTYEYYIANNDEIAPTATTIPTGTTDDVVNIISNGIYKVYYRTVSNSGWKSDWSNAAYVKKQGTPMPVLGQKVKLGDEEYFRVSFDEYNIIRVGSVINFDIYITASSQIYNVQFNDVNIGYNGYNLGGGRYRATGSVTITQYMLTGKPGRLYDYDVYRFFDVGANGITGITNYTITVVGI